MNDTIDLIWAKLPTFHAHYHEASNDALVIFAGFLAKDIFSMVKPYWEGYVTYQHKKTAVYKPEVIEILLKNSFLVNLEGCIFNHSMEKFPGSLYLNKLLNSCDKSHNKIIAKMSYKQRQLIIYTQIKRELWALFAPSEVTEKLEDYKSGEWTVVRPSKNDKEYDFNLARGLLHYQDIQKDPDLKDSFIQVHRIAYLKNDKKINPQYDEQEYQLTLEQLVKLVLELKKYGNNVESFSDFDFQTQWANGFIADTFEPKSFFQKQSSSHDNKVKENNVEHHKEDHSQNDDSDIQNKKLLTRNEQMNALFED